MATNEEVIASSSSLSPLSESAEILFAPINQRTLAWQDIKEGIQKWPIWLMLAYQDIRLRYRRSVLGPLWFTISMGITVYSMGFLYAHLFHSALRSYYPFLVAGMLSWSLISSAIVELTDGLTEASTLIKQIKLPYSLYIHRITTRNIIIFFHNLLVLVPILIIFHSTTKVNFNTLLLFPGLGIFYVNAISYGTILGIIGARYRDISQVIKSLIQIIFFVTPVMWGPEVLKEENRYIVNLNPFYSFIECIRAPLLGQTPTLINLCVVLGITIVGFVLSYFLFERYRSRIVYWL